MEPYKLFDAEYRFMNIIWEREPVNSTELVRLCREKLGWKKSTTYTMLRKLSEKGMLRNEEAIVCSILKREDTQKLESHAIVDKAFGGSLPQFLTAFLGGKKLTEQEAKEIQKIIDEATQ